LNILAIDTADQVLSVALETGAGVSYMEIDARSRHSELLLELVDQLRENSGIKPADIDLIACMKGPGSFTGLRIGFSAAKGMALALKIPLVTVPTLDCLAYPLSIWPGIVIPAMDAKKNSFFAALYRGGQRLTEYMDASSQAITREIAATRRSPDERIVLTGCGAQLLYSRLSECYTPEYITLNPESRKGGARELLKISKTTIIDAGEINSGPVYLRKSDAELNSVKE